MTHFERINLRSALILPSIQVKLTPVLVAGLAARGSTPKPAEFVKTFSAVYSTG